MITKSILQKHLDSIEAVHKDCDFCSTRGKGEIFLIIVGHARTTSDSSIKDLGLSQTTYHENKHVGEKEFFICEGCMARVFRDEVNEHFLYIIPALFLLLWLFWTKRFSLDFSSIEFSLLSYFTILFLPFSIWHVYSERKDLLKNKHKREETLGYFVASHPKSADLEKLYPPPDDWGFYTKPALDE